MPDHSLHQSSRRLQRLLDLVASQPNSFYGRHFQNAGIMEDQLRVSDFTLLPFTRKEDLLADRILNPPFGTNFTEPLERYTRFCQTSGTSSGLPMAVLDTPESWEAMLDCWRKVYTFAGVQKGMDRIYFAFSFGPFLGFWTAFEAASRDYLVLPGGGLSSSARLEMMVRYEATVLCCTPTYALRLGEIIGEKSGIELSQLKIRKIIVAGEAGGSLSGTRARLQELWGEVQIFDHHGMTEVGPVSYEDPEHPQNLCIIEDAYRAEIVDTEGNEVEDGAEGELVLTTLKRTASPLIRYRTGDWVRKERRNGKLYLKGGILSRCDDMVVIRGVNLYPTAIENVVLRFPEVAEFVIEQKRVKNMEEIEVLLELYPAAEDTEQLKRHLEDCLRDTFSLRIAVKFLESGTLPKAEFKTKRWRRC